MATTTPAKVPLEDWVATVNCHRENRGQPKEIQEKFARICAATKIRNMAWNCYDFHKGTDRENEIHQGKRAGEPGPGERDSEFKSYNNAERGVVWEHLVMRLSEEAASKAVKNWGGDISKISHIVSCTTTGWREPGVSSNLIHHLGLEYDTQKIELNFNGCFAGLSCLRTARDIVRAAEPGDKPPVVLVVSTEVASVQYQPNVYEPTDLVATSLFSDGSAAFIVTTEGPWRFEDTGCSVVPNSSHLLSMQPEDPKNPDRNCFQVILDSGVSSGIRDYFVEGNGVQMLKRMMSKLTHKDKTPDIAVHPGGPRILDGVLKALVKEGFEENVLESSYDTLFENGNLGSAAVLFVLNDMLASTKADDVLALAFGPGVTVEHANLVRV
jgi:predicted naringenin-chalcone synthase